MEQWIQLAEKMQAPFAFTVAAITMGIVALGVIVLSSRINKRDHERKMEVERKTIDSTAVRRYDRNEG